MKIDFNKKIFALLESSSKGEVSKSTLFSYKQHGNLVTAVYHGGNVRYGLILAILEDAELDMRYQYVTDSGELKSGKAIAEVTLNKNGKIIMELIWGVRPKFCVSEES